ncbi:MAG: hypothetical protein AAGK04_03630 [Planctomycetota bacterium]
MREPTAERRVEHRNWLLSLTGVPTAAGREARVVAWVERWLSEREGLALERDEHGNLTLSLNVGESIDEPPVYFTAHLDHPAFVVERMVSPTIVELAFRGGVMDDYFHQARVVIHDADEGRHRAVLDERDGPQEPYKRFLAELIDTESSGAIAVGDVATWDLPKPEIVEVDGVELLRTPACDDLAAAVAALAALDELRLRRLAGEPTLDARVLFTRAEEIGFVGAIGACRAKTIPEDARVIALENSRANLEAPIGGGPIVRVGDRLTIFDPRLTGGVAKRMEQISGGSAHLTAQQKKDDTPSRPWQRKLMAGGACEATVFCNFGLRATCVCLPLGNYHNMGRLDEMQAGAVEGTPPIEPEEIAIGDFEGMVDLLTACGLALPTDAGMGERLEKIWSDRAGVLREA